MLPTGFRYVGQSVKRFDVDKVYGGALFAGDIELPGMLWIKLVSAPVCTCKDKEDRLLQGAQARGLYNTHTRDIS